MKKENYFVGLVRIATRRMPFLYKRLARLYHDLIYKRQTLRIHRKYPDVMCIRYDAPALQEIKSNGFYSQYGQDYFLCDQGIVPKEGGVFLDIGCNDPVVSSNSYYFEKNLGYNGIAIDPLNNFEDKWKKERPNTVFVKAFISNSNEEIDFVEVTGDRGWENKLSGAADRVNLKGKNISTKTRQIKTSKLQEILNQNSIDFGVDLLSVDVEGYEIEVLSSVEWSEKRPNTIVIENTGSWEDQEILRSFIIDKGYKYYARILIADDIFIKA